VAHPPVWRHADQTDLKQLQPLSATRDAGSAFLPHASSLFLMPTGGFMSIQSILRNALATIACLALIHGTANAVDGVLLINQSNAIAGNVTPGDTAGFPVSINLPGIYKLSSNLVVPNENTTAIQINVNNVTIDLNGFAILGPNVCATDGFSVAQPCTKPGNGMGIDGGTLVPFNVENTRVMNGTIDGMGNIGIFANVNARVEKMNVSSNGSYGIYTFGGVILDTLVRGNGNTGITTTGAIIRDSRSIFNRGYGMQTTTFSVISGSVVATNMSYGLVMSSNTRYVDNLIDNNNGGIANPQIAGGTHTGDNTCGGAPCP
jgi:hypothetical protein